MTSHADCWLVEISGENRQVFGPYTEDQALAEKGRRYFVARGNLTHGEIIPRGELRNKLQVGSVRVVESGISADHIA